MVLGRGRKRRVWEERRGRQKGRNFFFFDLPHSSGAGKQAAVRRVGRGDIHGISLALVLS